VISPNFANLFVLANVFLGVGTLCGCMGMFLGKEGGIQVLAGLAPSSQNRRILTENPLAGKAGFQKNLAKTEFRKFTSMDKYPQLLLIEHIWQIKKFDKVEFYQKFCGVGSESPAVKCK
jgi:hypothetical protein